MKDTIVNQMRNINPVEWFRIKQGLSQKEFAAILGYNNTRSYQHHCKRFSKDILERVIVHYGLDLSHEVIRYLHHRIEATAPTPCNSRAGNQGDWTGRSLADRVG